MLEQNLTLELNYQNVQKMAPQLVQRLNVANCYDMEVTKSKTSPRHFNSLIILLRSPPHRVSGEGTVLSGRPD